MAYISQINVIWNKLSTEGSTRRPTHSRESYDNLVAVFRQAERSPQSAPSTADIDTYRAEYNVWAYYFGEDVPFPGIDPSPATTGQSATTALAPPHTTFPEAAARMRQQIEGLWVGRWSREDYQPQLGWNPNTGEPWMAVRSYAENSYPALSGGHHLHLKAIQDMMPEFVLQYERFPHLGYTLIWPEFKATADLKNQGAWKRFGKLRAFLGEWSSMTGKAPYIHKALEEYLAKADDERPGLPLPEGFVLNILQAGSRDLEQCRFTPIGPRRSPPTAHRRRRYRCRSSHGGGGSGGDATSGRSRSDSWRREDRGRNNSKSRDRGGWRRRSRARSPKWDRQLTYRSRESGGHR